MFFLMFNSVPMCVCVSVSACVLSTDLLYNACPCSIQDYPRLSKAACNNKDINVYI